LCEARIADALHHPHIVSILDAVLKDGEPSLIQEHLPSRSLGGIGTRSRVDETTAHGGTSACSLMQPADLAIVPGLRFFRRRGEQEDAEENNPR
jgi:hypothetical protein